MGFGCKGVSLILFPIYAFISALEMTEAVKNRMTLYRGRRGRGRGRGLEAFLIAESFTNGHRACSIVQHRNHCFCFFVSLFTTPVLMELSTLWGVYSFYILLCFTMAVTYCHSGIFSFFFLKASSYILAGMLRVYT